MAVKKTAGSTSCDVSVLSLPNLSYRARSCSFCSTWYASPTAWNFAAASLSSGFLSGCTLSASFRYAFLISIGVADGSMRSSS